MTDSSQTRLSYIEEATWGTTPATPTWTNVRFTGESLVANIQNTQSQEIRSDRNVADLAQVGADSGGSVNVEMSYGGYMDDWLEAALGGTWATNILKNGSEFRSYTLEKTFEQGATDQYHRFPGSVIDTMSFSLAPGSIATGSFGFVGKNGVSAQAEVATSTYTAVNTNPVMNAASDFASLAITGATAPELTALDINVTNNLRTQPVMGQLGARGVGLGQFSVSGSATAYFENAELYELFLDGTEADLSFKIGGSTALNYIFDIPRLKFQTAQVNNPGNNQDVLVNLTFQGLFDSGESAALKVTRDPT